VITLTYREWAGMVRRVYGIGQLPAQAIVDAWIDEGELVHHRGLKLMAVNIIELPSEL
jgi:hypothetical protein